MFRQRFFYLILLYAKKARAFLLSRDALIFLCFLLLSFAFWYMQSLRKKYEVDVNVRLSYENIPVDIINEADLPKNIVATLREQGFYIFLYNRRKTVDVTLDFATFRQNRDKSFTVTNDVLLNQLKESVMQSTQIVRLSPNTFSIKAVRKIGKKVPLRFNGEITFAQQYNLSDSVHLQPQTVDVYGDRRMLDTLRCLYTEFASFRNLRESVDQNIAIAHSEKLTVSPITARIVIPVERFTERTVSVAVQGRGIPEGMTLRTFPSNVNVRFFINESKFSSVENIKAFVDYSDITANKNGKLTPKIETKNPFVKNIQCRPGEVEFLLEQNK